MSDSVYNYCAHGHQYFGSISECTVHAYAYLDIEFQYITGLHLGRRVGKILAWGHSPPSLSSILTIAIYIPPSPMSFKFKILHQLTIFSK